MVTHELFGGPLDGAKVNNDWEEEVTGLRIGTLINDTRFLYFYRQSPDGFKYVNLRTEQPPSSCRPFTAEAVKSPTPRWSKDSWSELRLEGEVDDSK